MEGIKNVAIVTSQPSVSADTSSAQRVVASLPQAMVTGQSSDVSLDKNKLSAVSNEAMEEMISRGEADIKEAFNIERSTFYVMELPDGRLFTRVRNLDTGEVNFFPALDPFSYNQAINADRGVFLKTDV